MSWFVLVLLSTVTFALATLLQRVLLKEKDSDPITYAIFFQILVAFMALFFAVGTQQFSLSGIERLWKNIALMTFIYAGANFFIFKSLKLAEASEVSVIGASRALWSLAGAVLFLREEITQNIILGTLLIVSGIVAVSYRQGKWVLTRGHLFALLAAVFYGFGFVNDAFVLKTLNVPSYMFIDFLFPALFMLLIYPKSVHSLQLFRQKKRLFRMLLLAGLFGVSALAVYSAVKVGGPASKVFPIGQSYVILTVILAVIFLKERSHLANKLIGAILVYLGVLLLR